MKGIVSKLMEARHSKSMDSYELLAQFCSKESISKLILPLKEVRMMMVISLSRGSCICTCMKRANMCEHVFCFPSRSWRVQPV